MEHRPIIRGAEKENRVLPAIVFISGLPFYVERHYFHPWIASRERLPLISGTLLFGIL